jgi:hypothetical protein
MISWRPLISLLQVHRTNQVLLFNGHFSKFITISICNTPLLDKHHEIVLCVLLFETYNCPSCDLFFKILHNTSATYLAMVSSISTYLQSSSSRFPMVPLTDQCILNFLSLSLVIHLSFISISMGFPIQYHCHQVQFTIEQNLRPSVSYSIYEFKKKLVYVLF